MNMEKSAWMVRSGGGGLLIDEFMSGNLVAVGWNDLGEIPSDYDYNQLKNLYFEKFPESTSGSAGQSCSQIWRFIKLIKIGDIVLTYEPGTRLYYKGIVESDYGFDRTLSYQHFRKVKWERVIPRDSFSIESKNTLGSVLTVFAVPDEVVKEITSPNRKVKDESEEINITEAEELNLLKSDVGQRSKEFIQDLIAKLSWEDTERLVAGILNSMGYKTRFTSRGSDLGSDILASIDGLGLEEPRIKVEVKKRTSDKIGAPDIRNFIGGLRTVEKGVYVATTGFSKEARYEAERANFAITLIDSDLLVELIVENYELLAPEMKALIPLRKIYWPV